MKLHNTTLRNYNGFTLDTDKIELHSTSKRNIELPYSGPMPAQFADTSNPRIYFNVQAAQGANVLLVADKPDGKKFRAVIEASEEEIKSILRRFFFCEGGKARFNCGLIPYWLGTWATHFLEWERTRHSVWNIIDRLTTAERASLLAELQRTDTTAATA